MGGEVLLIDFSRGFGAEFRWWIMVGCDGFGAEDHGEISVVGCGGTMGLGLSFVVALVFDGFAWCFLRWLCDVVIVGCVVDGGWWLCY